MRRLVVALIAAALVLGLAGCGGSTPAADTAATPAPAPAPAPAKAAAVPANAVKGWSDNEPAVFSAFPTSTSTPPEINDNIAAKQPTLIFFYDSSQNSSKDSRKIIDAVIAKNRGLVELVAYDLGKYMVGDASKPIEIDKKFASDTKAQAAVELARTLGVSYTPFIVLTDGQGYIVWKFKGLVERDFLEREVLRASN
jgi:hypothetical protein